MSNQNQNDNGIIKEKLKKVEELKEIGVEPYGRKYEKLNNISEINQYDETCDKVFYLMMRPGKASRQMSWKSKLYLLLLLQIWGK